jgi:hypothetical protein
MLCSGYARLVWTSSRAWRYPSMVDLRCTVTLRLSPETTAVLAAVLHWAG